MSRKFNVGDRVVDILKRGPGSVVGLTSILDYYYVRFDTVKYDTRFSSHLVREKEIIPEYIYQSELYKVMKENDES